MRKKEKSKNAWNEEKAFNRLLRQFFIFNLYSVIERSNYKQFELLHGYLDFLYRRNESGSMRSLMGGDDAAFILAIKNIVNDCMDAVLICENVNAKSDNIEAILKSLRVILDKRLLCMKDIDFNVDMVTLTDNYIDAFINYENLYSEYVSTLRENQRELFFEQCIVQSKEIASILFTFNNALFVLMTEFRNINIEGAMFTNGKNKLIYGYDRVLTVSDIQKTKGHEDTISMVDKKDSFREFVSKIMILCEKFSADRIRAFYNEHVPSPYMITDRLLFDFPNVIQFVSFYFDMTTGVNQNSHGGKFLSVETILKIRNGKKYCIPKDGAVIEFAGSNFLLNKITVYEACEFYTFVFDFGEARFTYAVLKSHVDYYLDKLGAFHSNNPDATFEDFDKVMQYACSNIEHSHETLAMKEYPIYRKNLSHTFLMCLYILYVDMYLCGVRVYSQRIDKNADGSCHVVKEANYRTAHIRRLPNGWRASDEAKQKANEFGITIPVGYTFVREFVIDYEKRMRKVVVHSKRMTKEAKERNT